MATTSYQLVITTFPDEDSAMALARLLIDQRLAACVHCLPAGTSVYRWRGKVETSSEHTLLIKTLEARFPDLQAAIVAAHPDELPEIIAVPIVDGLAGYFHWLESMVTPLCE